MTRIRLEDIAHARSGDKGDGSNVGVIAYTEAGYRALARRFVAHVTPGASISGEDKLEPLRAAIVAKNEQFFNKWRPQNETYLTGFRKHEQGKNAKEIAEFDPFITKAEEK